MLVVATAFKLLAEIALFALVGQWILGLLAGEGKSTNPFYRVLQLVGKPWMLVARWLSPRVVLDRHLPWVAVLLVALVWLVANCRQGQHLPEHRRGAVPVEMARWSF